MSTLWSFHCRLPSGAQRCSDCSCCGSATNGWRRLSCPFAELCTSEHFDLDDCVQWNRRRSVAQTAAFLLGKTFSWVQKDSQVCVSLLAWWEGGTDWTSVRSLLPPSVFNTRTKKFQHLNIHLPATLLGTLRWYRVGQNCFNPSWQRFNKALESFSTNESGPY